MAKSPVALFHFIDRNRPPADQGDGGRSPDPARSAAWVVTRRDATARAKKGKNTLGVLSACTLMTRNACATSLSCCVAHRVSTSGGQAENPRFAWTFLRVLLHNTLHNPIGNARVESHLRYFLSFGSRGDIRIEILLNNSNKLQVLGVGFPQRDFRNVSHAAVVTVDVSVSRRGHHQHSRGDEQDGDGHADRRSDIGETHARISTQLWRWVTKLFDTLGRSSALSGSELSKFLVRWKTARGRGSFMRREATEHMWLLNIVQ